MAINQSFIGSIVKPLLDKCVIARVQKVGKVELISYLSLNKDEKAFSFVGSRDKATEMPIWVAGLKLILIAKDETEKGITKYSYKIENICQTSLITASSLTLSQTEPPLLVASGEAQ